EHELAASARDFGPARRAVVRLPLRQTPDPWHRLHPPSGSPGAQGGRRAIFGCSWTSTSGREESVFRKGDIIVHPEHGAAVIEELRERVFLGERRKYLVLRVAHGDLTLMVPIDS